MGCGGSTSFDPNVMSMGHFEVQRVVGQGGFGKVNACIRTSTKEWFAVKQLSKIPVLATNNVAMLMNERDLLASMTDHPFVVNLHYAFQDPIYCYLVLDLQLGGDLGYHLQKNRKPYGPERTRFYVACIAIALSHLHQQRILHRDIKPENVVLDSSGYPRLTDLGISHKVPPGPNLECSLPSGTKRYMAPEQLTRSHVHDQCADYWQLGMCAHEFLTGKGPHQQCPKSWSNDLDKFNESREDFPEITAEVSSAIPTVANDFVTGLLHVAPWRRPCYKTGNDFSDFTWCEQHPWFKDFDWDACRAKTMPVAFVPDSEIANCDTGDNDAADAFGVAAEPQPPPQADQDKFNGYDFKTDLVPGGKAATVVAT
jgi:serine/threonine kinase 32